MFGLQHDVSALWWHTSVMCATAIDKREMYLFVGQTRARMIDKQPLSFPLFLSLSPRISSTHVRLGNIYFRKGDYC